MPRSPKKKAAPPKAKGKPAKVKGIDKAIAEGEKPYSLPRGCELNEVLSDIRRYQCFEFNRAVYMMRGKSYDQVSNFTCTIHQHIVDQEHPMKLITIGNVDKEEWTFEEKSEAFLSCMGFRKSVTSRGNFQWTGSELDYYRYLSYMMDRMGNGRMITEMGWQPEGFFAMRTAALNTQTIHYDARGCFEHDGEMFYVPAGNSIYNRDENKYATAKRVELIEGVDFSTWQKQMRKVHREHMMLATCFAVATAFSDYVFRRLQGFPLLFLYGSPGSGKDQLIQACQSLYGLPQPEIFLSGPNTDKGQIRMFAELINVPLNLAEYKAGMKREQVEFLKGLWGRIGYRRGNLHSKFSTDTVPIRCSAYVSGNDYPNQDDALMTRIIVEEMHKDKFTGEEKIEFKNLRRMVEHGYSAMLATVVKHRAEWERTWYDEAYTHAQGLLDAALEEHSIDGRMQQNLAVLLSTFLFFEKKLAWCFARGELVEHMVKLSVNQQKNRATGNEVSKFWACFLAAVRKNRLKEGTHFRITDGMLFFFWDVVHATYMEVHNEIYQERGNGSASMRGKLEHGAGWLGPVGSCRIGEHRSSAYCFDLMKLEKSGTELASLLQTESARSLEGIEAI